MYQRECCDNCSDKYLSRYERMDRFCRKCEVDPEKEMLRTCSPTERAFLDEIREKGIFVEDSFGKAIYMGEETPTCIYQSDFKTNLGELVNE